MNNGEIKTPNNPLNQPHPTRNGYNQRNDGHRVIAGHNERTNGRWQNNTRRATYQRGERLPIVIPPQKSIS